MSNRSPSHPSEAYPMGCQGQSARLVTRLCMLSAALCGMPWGLRPAVAQEPPVASAAMDQQCTLVAQLGHSSDLRSACFSPDARQILTASDDHTARLWDAASGKELRRFEGHTDRVLCACFSPDGRQVLTGSVDHTARLWSSSTGRELRRFTNAELVSSVCFSPDCSRVAGIKPRDSGMPPPATNCSDSKGTRTRCVAPASPPMASKSLPAAPTRQPGSGMRAPERNCADSRGTRRS